MTLNTPPFQQNESPLTSTLLIATHNAGKLRELQNFLKDLPLEVVSLAQLALPSPEETGHTFRENARIKAEAAGLASNLWSLADDSGLEVNALGGAPGVLTADYGGWKKLLSTLRDTPNNERDARFVCVLALRSPEGEVRYFEGHCAGRIASTPSGTEGFGYDPVFIPEGYTHTFAEMPPEQKQSLSHRGKALSALRDWLLQRA